MTDGRFLDFVDVPDDMIITQVDESAQRDLEHVACRNCGQEYYAKPSKLALGCMSCGTSPGDWDGNSGLFKWLDV